MRRISRPERAALDAFVRAALVEIGCPQWSVILSDRPVADDSTDEANIDPDDASDTAELRLGSAFWKAAEPEQRRILTHELAHLVLYRTTDYVHSLKRHVPPDLWAHFWDEFEKKEDIAIETLAQLFVDRLPRLKMPRRPR